MNNPLVVVLNLVLHLTSYILALGLRFDFSLEEISWPSRLIIASSALLVCRLASYMFFNFNQRSWSSFSSYDLIELVKVHAISSVLFTAMVGFLRVEGFPRSVIFIEFVLSLILPGGAKLATRYFYENNFLTAPKSHQKVLVVGSGVTGQMVIRNLLGAHELRYQPVGILDDNLQIKGFRLHGIPVLGPISSLKSHLNSEIDLVIFAIPRLSNDHLKSLQEICKQADIPYRTMSSLEDIVSPVTNNEIENQNIFEKLLSKEVNLVWEKELKEEFQDKTVLITGAGGSIGSELSKQIVSGGAKKVLLIDQNEYSLHKLSISLKDINPKTQIDFFLADICNKERLNKIFKAHKPDLIFHSAAYKHVPFVEINPFEAFTNNILSTANLMGFALENNVQKFITISSDKAVNPSSLMGATKRINELMVFELGQKLGLNNFSAVRFGNVINSSGSVIPLFQSQILSGGPITVTHPDMERFFMSTPEAVRLVLTAGVLAEKGGLFVLDMGEPIKVLDIAKRMKSLYGKDDIEIIFTGIRSGEKLKEFVTSPLELLEKTNFSKIQRVKSIEPLNATSIPSVFEWVSELEDKFSEIPEEKLKAAILSFVDKADRAFLLAQSQLGQIEIPQSQTLENHLDKKAALVNSS